MKRVVQVVEHGVVFVMDPNAEVAIPEHSPGQMVASTRTCVSVATLSEVDGEVELQMSDGLRELGEMRLTRVFDGFIETPHRSVALATSSNRSILEVAVDAARAHVVVSVDDVTAPTVVHVAVRD